MQIVAAPITLCEKCMPRAVVKKPIFSANFDWPFGCCGNLTKFLADIFNFFPDFICRAWILLFNSVFINKIHLPLLIWIDKSEVKCFKCFSLLAILTFQHRQKRRGEKYSSWRVMKRIKRSSFGFGYADDTIYNIYIDILVVVAFALHSINEFSSGNKWERITMFALRSSI